MSYNSLMLDKLDAEKQLAIILEKGVRKTGHQIMQQAQTISAGVTRLTWYSSCFFDNYQDVCANLKKEDVRFGMAIIQVIKHHDIVKLLIYIFVKYWSGNMSDERVNKTQAILFKLGANISSSTITTRSFTYAVTSAICMSFGLRAAIDSKLKS